MSELEYLERKLKALDVVVEEAGDEDSHVKIITFGDRSLGCMSVSDVRKAIEQAEARGVIEYRKHPMQEFKA